MIRLLISFLFLTLTACSLFSSPGKGKSSNLNPTLKEMPVGKNQSVPVLKKRLMILPFLDSLAERPQSLRDLARADVIKELNYQGKLIVIDSKDLAIDPSKYIKEGQYDIAEISKEAAQLGVNALMEGKIISIRINRTSDKVGIIRQMRSEFECVVRVRIISARNGKELMNTTKTVILNDSKYRVASRVDTDSLVGIDPQLIQNLVKDSFLDFTPKVMQSLSKMEWGGRIAQIKGDLVYLNVGHVSGVQKGDILKVSEEGEDVYDPDTGTYIGKVPGRMKGTLEVVNFFGSDGAIAIIHSGAGFKENDHVELY